MAKTHLAQWMTTGILLLSVVSLSNWTFQFLMQCSILINKVLGGGSVCESIEENPPCSSAPQLLSLLNPSTEKDLACNIIIVGNFCGRKLFVNWWKIRFSQRKLSQIACTTKDATMDPMHPNFAEKTFANSHKTSKFAKFSSSKV